jgi:NAD-dependent dihydropyrimidine dehydrogenase PreA subunit
MIYYFSGTGNSKWVAEQLASKTDDIAVNMVGLSAVPSTNDQTIGIIFPIHAWGVPEPVLEFVKRLMGKPAFTFGVCTCGDEAGNAMEKLSSIFPLNSTYSVAMPSNYVMGADIESHESIVSKIAKAKEKLKTIAAQVIAKQSVNDVNKGKLSWVKSNLANFGFNKVARSTKPFYVTDKCISCGECAENCPANTITMVDGRPQWVEKCYQCTACINCCPTQAIEYGKGTSTRSRYQFKDN